jgi:hypothetical protein
MVLLHHSAWDGDPNAQLSWYLDSFEGESPLLSPEATHGAFFLLWSANGGQVAAPHWFIALCFLAIARLMFIRRFSVRALLVLMTITAIGFGLIRGRYRF